MSFPGRFVETSAGRVFVHRSGSGEPLVLLHGFLKSHYIFRPVLPRLAATHDVIALDFPGFGESDRPPANRYGYDSPAFAATVVEVLDALKVERAAVMGHSMGGGAALTLAARWPERVSRLVLVCPAVYPLPMPPESALLLSAFGAFAWRHLVRRADYARIWRGRHVRDPRSVTEEWLDYYWARFNRAGAREASYAALVALSKLNNNSADPLRVRVPTVLIWPEDDRVIPLAQGRRLQRALPGAELRIVPACGHDLFLERPDELLRQIGTFLDGGDEPALPVAARHS